MGDPTILVNCAGIERVAPSTDLSHDDWQQVLDVNLGGTFRCSQAFAPGMLCRRRWQHRQHRIHQRPRGHARPRRVQREQGRGRGGHPGPLDGVGRLGIRVNAVAPGYVWTRMLDEATEAHGADIRDKVPARRLARPDEIASAVLYLVSEGASFVHGHTLVVDGGYAAYGAPASTAFRIDGQLTD